MNGIDARRLHQVSSALPGAGLAALRQQAVARLANSGIPDTRSEEWKYTNLASSAEFIDAWLADPGVSGGSIQIAGHSAHPVVESVDAHWLIVRNGVLQSDPARVSAESGLTIQRLDGSEPELSETDDPLSDLNLALLTDGIKITVPDGVVVERPLGLLMLADSAASVTQCRLLISVGASARLQVIEMQASAGPDRQLSNIVMQCRIANSGTLEHVRIQDRGIEQTGFSRYEYAVYDNARLSHHGFDLGGGLIRNDIRADLLGRDASVTLGGLYFGTGAQHVDNHTCIRHSTGPSSSREEYRGVLGGRSRAVFNGKVIVCEGADGTDSAQSNHTLLLSDNAEIDTKPELQIFADDVKCSHGATVGQLDEDALFYLRSRGLDMGEAREALTRAFGASLLAEIRQTGCHDYLSELLDVRLKNLVEASQ